MKAPQKKTLIAAAIVAALLLVCFSTSSWRAEHGLSFRGKQVQGPEAELNKLDQTLIPVLERRDTLRSQLENSQKKEREIGEEISAKLAKFDDSKRAELREQFETRALSEKNMKSPEIAPLYARYIEAVELRRHTSTLREQLATYEYQLTLALAQRDRLQERVDSIKQLGFDPESGVTLDNEKKFDALDELVSQTEALKPEAKKDELTVADVVNDNADAQQVAEELFTNAAKEEPAKEETPQSETSNEETVNETLDSVADDMNGVADDLNQMEDGLSKLFGDLAKQDVKLKVKAGPFSKTVEYKVDEDGTVTELAPSGPISDMFRFLKNGLGVNHGLRPGRFIGIIISLFVTVSAGLMAIGITLAISLLKPKQQYDMQGNPLPTQSQIPSGMNQERVVLMIASMLVFAFFLPNGPFGAIVGLVVGYFASSWRAFFRILAVLFCIGIFLLFAVLAAIFIGICV